MRCCTRNDGVYTKCDGFCTENDGFALNTMDFVPKMTLYHKWDHFVCKMTDFVFKMTDFVSNNDEICFESSALTAKEEVFK